MYNGFTLCQQCQVDEIKGEVYAEKKNQLILTDDVIMKCDFKYMGDMGNMGKQQLRLLVNILFPITQVKNVP